MKRLGNAGDKTYDAYVGPPEHYDFMGATQFRLLTSFGLREYHKVLDIGCGSLRAGRLLIPFLNTGCYFGIEPNSWLIDEAKKNELGSDLFKVKKPVLDHNADFEMPSGIKFDFVLAQSIFSHTGIKLFEKAMNNIAKALDNSGFFFATFVQYEDEACDNEWYYPECVGIHHNSINLISHRNGLSCRRLGWLHPRQTWYLFSKNRQNIPPMFKLICMRGDVLNSTEFKHFRQSMRLRRSWYLFKKIMPSPVVALVRKLIVRYRNS